MINLKKIASIITCLLILTSGIQVLATDKSDEFNEIDSYMKSVLESANIPGASIAIVDKDSVLFEGTYGNCDSIDDSFIIGSLSKSFTAMAIMQLVENGDVNLDNPISTYLPEATDGDDITVKQLMNQTSGIDTYAKQSNYKIQNEQGQHIYANTNYDILGQIIEAVSGIEYANYIDKNIFKPIGMENSYTSLDDAKDNGLIDGYRTYFGITVKDRVPYPDSDGKSWLGVPSGYLISSSSDMAKYLQVYLNGGKDIVSQDSINTMFYDNVKFNDETDTYYGMGWNLTNNYSEPVITHGGYVENYITNMIILPDSDIALIMMCNSGTMIAMGNLNVNMTSLLIGDTADYNSGLEYWQYLLLTTVLFAVAFLLSILPLLRLKKWNLLRKKRSPIKVISLLAIIHFLVPTALLIGVPILSATPMFVIKGFVPDLYIVLLTCTGILYGTGVVKTVLYCRKPTG